MPVTLSEPKVIPAQSTPEREINQRYFPRWVIYAPQGKPNEWRLIIDAQYQEASTGETFDEIDGERAPGINTDQLPRLLSNNPETGEPECPKAQAAYAALLDCIPDVEAKLAEWAAPAAVEPEPEQ